MQGMIIFQYICPPSDNAGLLLFLGTDQESKSYECGDGIFGRGEGGGMIGVFLRNIHVRVQYFYILDGSVTSSPTMIIFMLYICSIVISF